MQMSEKMDAKQIEELKKFLEHCKQNLSVLHTPSLAFFKNFLQSLGAHIPPPAKWGEPSVSSDDIVIEDIVESDVELDNSDVVEPDNDPPQKMGDPSAEVTEENQEAAQLSKAKAMDAISEGNLDEAIDHLTEAIMLKPKSEILYANRASVFVKLKKPNAAIRDADAALKINPRSAKGYEARGMAKAMLGLWEEAARDFHVVPNLDFDEEINAVLKKVYRNANKLEEHRRKYELLRKEREKKKIELERQRRAKSQMGDPSAEVTEENQEAAQLSKAKAMDAISEGNLDEAIYHLTEAIMLNPKLAILYANRASVFVTLKKPNAAIRDADAALKINPDSAKGYKARGMAKAMLSLWEEAARDLHVASNLDFDEEINEVLKKVEPNANKLEEHRLRKEREKKKIELERQRRAKSQEAEAASLLKDGEVIRIHSASELKSKLDAASKTSRLAVLYFTATCGPCRVISPVFTNLAGKYKKVVFLKINIDESRDAAAQWNISSVPTFFFMKNGREVDRVVGANKNSLEEKISQHSGYHFFSNMFTNEA